MTVDVRQIPKLPPAWLARIALAGSRALSRLRRSLVPAQLYLFELSTALWTAQCLHAVARLGIADRLAAGPATAQTLAGALGLNAGALYRVLRLLAGYGVVKEDRERRFTLTRIGEKLRPGAPGSAHAMLVYNGQRWQTEPYAELEHTLRTGEPAFDHIFGKPFFDYAAVHADVAAVFDAAMTSVAQLHAGAVLGAYRFEGIATVVDIGGGNGLLISAILSAHPHLRGVLFDLPHVVPGAAPQLRAAGVAERCDVRAGDFFEAVPAGADAYLLSHILHDWDDRRCLTILRACRAAMSHESRLLVVDVIVAEGDNRFDQGKLSDMQMLLVLTGRERTAAEFRELLGNAGFSVRRVIRTAAPECIIEAFPR